MDLLTHHSERVDLLELTWALQHPYLHTLIEISHPTLYVIIIVAGLKVLFMRRVRR